MIHVKKCLFLYFLQKKFGIDTKEEVSNWGIVTVVWSKVKRICFKHVSLQRTNLLIIL